MSDIAEYYDYYSWPDEVSYNEAWGYCDKMCHRRDYRSNVLQEVSLIQISDFHINIQIIINIIKKCEKLNTILQLERPPFVEILFRKLHLMTTFRRIFVNNINEKSIRNKNKNEGQARIVLGWSGFIFGPRSQLLNRESFFQGR